MSNDEVNVPADRTRVGAQQRDAAAFGLSLALQDGQLDFAEVEKRTEVINKVIYVDEVLPVLADVNFGQNLPAATDPQILVKLTEGQAAGVLALSEFNQESSKQTSAPVNVKFSHEVRATSTLVAFWPAEKRGEWSIGPQHNIIGAFGSADIDMTRAQLATQLTTVKVTFGVGSVKLHVPETYQIVHDNVQTFAGSVKITDHPSVGLALADVPQGTPVIDLHGRIVFGSIEVERVPVAR